MDFLFTPEAISSLLTLTFLEIILGIDNIVFISIVVGKLPEEKRKGATNIGLLLALVLRIMLLFAISWLIAMQSTLFEITNSVVHAAVNGQSLILFAGGLFLIYKSTKEIHEKIYHAGEKSKNVKNKAANTLGKILLQIILIDAVFSVDSILTAVGMTSGIDGAIWRPSLNLIRIPTQGVCGITSRIGSSPCWSASPPATCHILVWICVVTRSIIMVIRVVAIIGIGIICIIRAVV